MGFHGLSLGLKRGVNGVINIISFSSRLMHPPGLKNSPLEAFFTWKTTSGLLMQSMQMPEMTLVRKKGSQQMMNTPITVPKVLAAFFSFANLVTFQGRKGGRYSKS